MTIDLEISPEEVQNGQNCQVTKMASSENSIFIYLKSFVMNKKACGDSRKKAI